MGNVTDKNNAIQEKVFQISTEDPLGLSRLTNSSGEKATGSEVHVEEKDKVETLKAFGFVVDDKNAKGIQSVTLPNYGDANLADIYVSVFKDNNATGKNDGDVEFHIKEITINISRDPHKDVIYRRRVDEIGTPDKDGHGSIGTQTKEIVEVTPQVGELNGVRDVKTAEITQVRRGDSPQQAYRKVDVNEDGIVVLKGTPPEHLSNEQIYQNHLAELVKRGPQVTAPAYDGKQNTPIGKAAINQPSK